MRSLIPFLLVVIALAGCTKIIDIPGTQQQDPPSLVVNAVLTQDTGLVVYVSRNYSIIGKTPQTKDLVVRDATVTVYEEDVLFATLQFQDSLASDPTSSTYFFGKLGYFGPANKRPAPGKTYRIVVSHPNFPTATATTRLPLAPEIKGANIRFNAIIDADQRSLAQVIIKLGEVHPTSPYLAVAIGGYTVNPFIEAPFLNWLYPAIQQSPGGFFGNYQAFANSRGYQGGNYLIYPASVVNNGELSFYVYDINEVDTTASTFDSTLVSVVGIDAPYANYMLRFDQHMSAQDPGVAFFQGEKLPMLNNIEGGYGIWGSYTKKDIVMQ